ncbi:DUF3883 domain-containing protein [Deinococcus arcticus]|uniref:Protein NO VEIN C-terminal domain-containing protein n=1 Tax=Deinococcus arcticus TaxID=2136176 RepID=A0A2T3W3D4_9DEIO|nr:DUF3883 domain-containing protein [Deinococcus arcticus]PTA66405.1 hypothetical protein C8263_18100 [Deinococcus arcticus]
MDKALRTGHAEGVPSHQPWADHELDELVADYFTMLALETQGRPFNKAAHNRTVGAVIQRSKGALEFKRRNISAVLEALGMPWVHGYLPATHFQADLVPAVQRYLHRRAAQVSAIIDTVPKAVDDLRIVEVPARRAAAVPPELQRLVQKFDPLERDLRNRTLGEAGERLVITHERQTLIAAGRDDLAREVEWSSKVHGDGLGYDIRSFTPVGEERQLEVKTTRGSARTPFFMTRNEKRVAENLQRTYRLCRVYAFGRPDQAMFILAPPLSDALHFAPETWRVGFAE